MSVVLLVELQHDLEGYFHQFRQLDAGIIVSVDTFKRKLKCILKVHTLLLSH